MFSRAAITLGIDPHSSSSIYLIKYWSNHNNYIQKLECGPLVKVMVTLLNIGGALCSTPQSLAEAHYMTAVQ